VIKLKPKRVRVSEVIGIKFSNSELANQKKFGIWTPENTEMIVSNERALSVAAFERKLKKLDSRLFIHFNTAIPSKAEPFGHIIRFHRPDIDEKYDFIVGVGIGGNKLLPAQSQYKHFYNEEKKVYETRMIALGWVASQEAVIHYLLARKSGA